MADGRNSSRGVGRHLKRFGIEVTVKRDKPSKGRKDVRVSMLGPRGVGKTSLLAGMYDQFEHVIRKADLQLATAEEGLKAGSTAALLDEKVTQLHELFVTDGDIRPATDALSLNPRGGLAGTRDTSAFPFRLGRRGREGGIWVTFFDYPGAFLERSGPGYRPGWVVDLLRNSHVILIPVDAPALIENDGRWNEEHNKPEFIFDLVSQAFGNLESPRLVLLCPIRCERYVQTEADKRQLLARTTQSYGRLLEWLAPRDLVAVAVTPVQTLGEVVLDRIPDAEYAPIFRKTRQDAHYAPVDTDQPLRYLVRFAIRLDSEARTRTWWAAMWQGLFGGDRYLIEASQRFAVECRTDVPFAVLQGEKWLEAPRHRARA
jgi:hypothetical protein